MESDNLVKNVIKNENYEETIQDLLEKIKNKENKLQEQIKLNYNEIIIKCATISKLKIKNDISVITQRLNDFSFTILINHNKLKENEEMLEKLEHVLHLSINLQKIIQKLEIKKTNIESYFDIRHIQKMIKIFKQNNFYEILKIQLNEKRKSLISKMNNECCEWLTEILSLCRKIGEKIVNNRAECNSLYDDNATISKNRFDNAAESKNKNNRNDESNKYVDNIDDKTNNLLLNEKKDCIVGRKELKLTIILESLYIYKKLEIEETFYNFFNAKRENVANNLKFYDLIGFLYVDKMLNEIDYNFVIKEINTNYDKEELIILLGVLQDFNINSKKVEAKIEKICVDFIFEKQEYVNSKEDTEKFFKDVSEYLRGVEQSCVFEIFYKYLDEMFMKYYEPKDIEKAIEEAKQYKNIKYCFRSKSILQDKINKEKEKVAKIFIEQAYHELVDLYLSEEIVLYVKHKFIEKMKSANNKRKIDGEVTKYYKFLQKHNSKLADLFYDAIAKCKEIYKH
ncbi:hypothetical protein BDAP_002845 [Binucleata daphniae]